MDRFIIRVGDKFDVIVGRKLNSEPLNRGAAERLALSGTGDTARPPPPMSVPAPPTPWPGRSSEA
jgi:hypothetical protein